MIYTSERTYMADDLSHVNSEENKYAQVRTLQQDNPQVKSLNKSTGKSL